jgi:hypothetical protein
MKVAYGKTAPTSATDPDVIALRRRIRFSQRAMIMYPGAYLVNAIPWLKYLPWYARDLKQEFEREKKLNIGRLNLVKEKMVYTPFSIFTSCLSHFIAEGRGHWPFVHEIYARK